MAAARRYSQLRNLCHCLPWNDPDVCQRKRYRHSRCAATCFEAVPRLRLGRPQARVPSAPRTAWERPEAFRQGIAPCQESVGDGNLTPSRDAELLAEDVAVGLDRSGRDAELLSDLLVGIAGSDELDCGMLAGAILLPTLAPWTISFSQFTRSEVYER